MKEIKSKIENLLFSGIENNINLGFQLMRSVKLEHYNFKILL